MSIPMTRKAVTLSVNRIEALNNDNSLRDGYDIILERICSYIDANVDDFIECYREDDDCELHDTDSLSDIIGGGQG